MQTEREFFNEKDGFQHDTKPENFGQRTFKWFCLCFFRHSLAPYIYYAVRTILSKSSMKPKILENHAIVE